MALFISISADELDNAPEPSAVQIDTEVKLEIIDVKVGTDKNGSNYLLPLFKLVDHPEAKAFTKFIGLPGPEQDPAKRAKNLLGLKRFYQALGIDYSNGVDSDALIGLTCWALVGYDTKYDGMEEYGPQNYIKRFVNGN